MNVQILSEAAAKKILADNVFPSHTAVVCFTDGEPSIDYSTVTDKVFRVDVPDISMDDLTDYKYTVDDFAAAMKANELAQFILDAYGNGYDFLCQCTYGESRSAAAAAAIREFFSHDGINVFADYRYCPNQLVFNTLYDTLCAQNRKRLKVNPLMEGLLDKEGALFNGIVFLMREPNTGGKKAEDFWFRKCLHETVSPAYEGNFNTYYNKFVRLLSYIYPGTCEDARRNELEHCAYFNLRPDGGNAQMSEPYIMLRGDADSCSFRFEEILKYCKKRIRDEHKSGTLHIFTCWDIVDALQKHGIIPNACADLTKQNGVIFKRSGNERPREHVQFEHNELVIHIYAIDHPSYSSSVMENERK